MQATDGMTARTAQQPVRIAMWSGPRNLSTAMMRSFASRGDCAVWDEPFYAAYLQATGIDHPMRNEVLAAHTADPDAVARALAGAAPLGHTGPPPRVYYQKHMTHHMLDAFDLGWCAQVRHAFLIRAPERVLASYHVKREDVSLADIGFEAQATIFDRVCDENGAAPPVIDASDVRAAPELTLRKLCAALNIDFTPRMLHWPAGPHPADGIWAKHWYGAVWQSTGFAPPENAQPNPELPVPHQRFADCARPIYERLSGFKI